MERTDELKTYLIKDVFSNTAAEIDENSSLIRDGLLNSIGLMKLIRFLSERFHIEFDTHDYRLENFETIARMRKLIDQKINGRLSGTPNA